MKFFLLQFVLCFELSLQFSYKTNEWENCHIGRAAGFANANSVTARYLRC